jgi:diguanylate cyclase (GGDEF)-like protein
MGSAAIGLSPLGDPMGRHLLELFHPSCAEAVRAEHQAARAAVDTEGWIEVLALAQDGRQVWTELKLVGLATGGALGILRSIAERRALEDRLFTAAMTDPLTRLTNRGAFVAMLDYLVDERTAGHLALFDLDHFRTVNLRHGHSGGDRVLVAFARLLRRLLRPDDILSRIGGGTFGVLLPDAGAAQAEDACAGIVRSVADMNAGARADDRLTVSAGIAPFAISADASLRAAELALLTAKAQGRSRVARSRPRAPAALAQRNAA